MHEEESQDGVRDAASPKVGCHIPRQTCRFLRQASQGRRVIWPRFSPAMIWLMCLRLCLLCGRKKRHHTLLNNIDRPIERPDLGPARLGHEFPLTRAVTTETAPNSPIARALHNSTP